MNLFIWLGLGMLVVVAGYFLDREIWFYEGVHLGPRLQAWLYDRWSKKYDADKHKSQAHDNEALAVPLLEALEDVPEPFVLDFATGTGRLSHAVLNRPEFKGRILALDLSRGMLKQAASKLAPHRPRVDLLRHRTLPLPFPDESFDAVCALEVLELFPSMEAPLAEFGRVLRPGGVLLTSRGTEESGRQALVRSREDLARMLEGNGFPFIEIAEWWFLFERVIAVKEGKVNPSSVHRLDQVYQCPACKHVEWKKDFDSLQCGHCGKTLSITSEGIMLG